MTTVTVYLNESRYGMIDGFVQAGKDAARLRQAVTFDVPDLPVYVQPEGLNTIETIQAHLAEHEGHRTTALNRIYEQLNVGGDLVPAEEYTTEYRAAGNRSLSVGDVVDLDGRPYAVARFGFDRVSNAAVKFAVRRFDREGSDIPLY